MRLLKLNIITLAFLLFALNACSYSPESRVNSGLQLAKNNGWQQYKIDAAPFQLTAFTPQKSTNSKTLYIYIEGDGLAWKSRSTPSQNPTPKNPMGLNLAIQHGGDAVYLARPCQYQLKDTNCASNKWWTSHRFAQEVINATNIAIDKLKRSRQADNLVLVGYSGGGAVALLAAAERSDVTKIITVAGNLDTDKWVELKNISPLSGSLNPADKWQKLAAIPQLHLVGGSDKVVPAEVAYSYASNFPMGAKPQIRVIKEYDHQCCWVEQWNSLLKQH